MKKKFYYILIFAAGLLFTAAKQLPEEFDSKALKAELKEKLKPGFKYDSSNTSRFIYTNKVSVKEIEVPLYIGEKYRFLFNTAGLPKDVKVEIYNKPFGHKKRKRVYLLEKKEKEHIYMFEPLKSKKLYINYTISAVEEEDVRGCLVMLVGFKSKFN